MNYAIIAAGDGSRLVSEGVSVPKPLVDIDGRPMIRRLIDIMQRAGAESVSVIVNEHMAEVRRYLREVAAPQMSVPLRLVVRSTPSSMHSFYELSRGMGAGKFVLTTVDTIFDEDEFVRYARAFENDPDADGYMAVTTYVDDEKPLYISADPSGRITAFTDSRREDTRYISGGIYGLQAPAAIEVLDRCIAAGSGRMRNYQRALVDAGLDLRAYEFGKILDVDHAADVDKAREFVIKHPVR